MAVSTSILYKKAAAKRQEDEKQGIPKFGWVSNSPDFNPVERIWTTLTRIQWRRASERVATITEMRTVLVDVLERLLPVWRRSTPRL